VVFDRGLINYPVFAYLTAKRVSFITRPRTNARIEVIGDAGEVGRLETAEEGGDCRLSGGPRVYSDFKAGLTASGTPDRSSTARYVRSMG
jgi:hypothetical protein